MNHNFLPFDICEMLPKENPNRLGCFTKKYSRTYVEDKFKVWEEKGVEFTRSLESYDIEKEMSYSDWRVQSFWERDAWTILDALILLEEQGYFIEVSGNWVFTIYDKVNNDILTCFPAKYNSRIETYTEGIRHCLNLMKDETNRS